MITGLLVAEMESQCEQARSDRHGWPDPITTSLPHPPSSRHSPTSPHFPPPGRNSPSPPRLSPPLSTGPTGPVSRSFKTITRSPRSKATRANTYKKDHQQLRSEVKWRSGDLRFENRSIPSPSAAVSIRPEDVVSTFAGTGCVSALFPLASTYDAPLPASVVPTPRRNDSDDDIRISTSASSNLPKRACMPGEGTPHRVRADRRRRVLRHLAVLLIKF